MGALFTTGGLILVALFAFANSSEYKCVNLAVSMEGYCKNEAKETSFRSCNSTSFKKVDPNDVAPNSFACGTSTVHPTAKIEDKDNTVIVGVTFDKGKDIEYSYKNVIGDSKELKLTG